MNLNFGNLPEPYCLEHNSGIVILPVPYDETSTWIKGADKGPEAIIDASANMELYDIETDYEVYKHGIFTSLPVEEKSSPEKMIESVYQQCLNYLNKNKFVVTIGGEHSISFGSIKAFCEKFQNLTVLQLDAHSDMREEYEESIYNHACVMARVKEICEVVQVGIRSMDISEKKNIDENRIFYAHQLENNSKWIDQVTSLLTNNVYITIDLDVFDPSILPSTGTPEPGGLFWYNVLQLIKNVNEKCNIVGFDVVELCPNNIEKASDFLAAKLIYKILSYKFQK